MTRCVQLCSRFCAVLMAALTGAAIPAGEADMWLAAVSALALLLADLWLHRQQARPRALSVSGNVPPCLLLLAALCVPGCTGALHPATVDAIREQAITARRTATNFQQMAPKLAAREQADAGAVDLWRVQHAVNLEAQANGMESLSRRVQE